MKRYVREFAADRKRYLRECIQANHDKGEYVASCTEEIERIDTVLNQCEYGYISDFEAVRQIYRQW